jgi:hypothetical protein
MSAIGVTADKFGILAEMVCPLMTQQRHDECDRNTNGDKGVLNGTTAGIAFEKSVKKLDEKRLQ